MIRPAELPRALARCVAALTIALIALGGAVHATGSSLACPDWPSCHGELLPEMTGGVAWEHGHRLLAGLVAALTAALAWAAYRRRAAAPRAARLAAVALALVLLQAVLGGVTVLLELPAAVSTLHLTVAMVFASVVTLLAADRARAAASRRARALVGAAWLALFAQVVLGGVVRHTGSAMACGVDPVLCGGEAWPAFGMAQLQMLHRAGALVVLALLSVACASVAAAGPLVRRLVGTTIALTLAQIALGVMSVVQALPVAAVTAHLAVAALLLSVWTLLGVRTGVLGRAGDEVASQRAPLSRP
ncbi:MAG: COX15/CtaA family protein [Sandaracinaceae bacterium]|nr:COX15/CtaA family protein [Sandaracinaceae bacterium]